MICSVLRRLSFGLALALAPLTAPSANIHVAQTAAGADDGSSAANAHSAAWFNTSGNWGGGGVDVDAGDTAVLNGTITTLLNVLGSGTAGNPITIQFAADAKISVAHMNGSAGLMINGRDYIIIDGGTNGKIECTANGTGLANATDGQGVFADDCNDLEIKNLTVSNMFVRTPLVDDAMPTNGIRVMGDGDNLSIHDCAVDDTNTAVFRAFAGTCVGFVCYNNTITNISAGILVGGEGSGSASYTGIEIYGNNIQPGNIAADTLGGGGPDNLHNDLIQWFANAGEEITGMKIHSNVLGPDVGSDTDTTAYLFGEGRYTGTQIYNNILVADASSLAPTNGFIYIKGSSGYVHSTEIYNNTIASEGQRGVGVNGNGTNDQNVSKNNTISGCNVAMFLTPTSSFATIDTNHYHNNDDNGTAGTNTISGSPLLDGTFHLQSGSPLIGAGLDLSAEGFTVDFDGDSRSDWDIGADEFGGGGGDVTPPTVSAAAINAAGTTLTLTMNETTTIGAGGSTGLTLSASGGAVSASYSSGAGSSSLSFSLDRTILAVETATRSYTQPGNGFEDAAGNDLATFSGQTVTNNSTQGGGGDPPSGSGSNKLFFLFP